MPCVSVRTEDPSEVELSDGAVVAGVGREALALGGGAHGEPVTRTREGEGRVQRRTAMACAARPICAAPGPPPHDPYSTGDGALTSRLQPHLFMRCAVIYSVPGTSEITEQSI